MTPTPKRVVTKPHNLRRTETVITALADCPATAYELGLELGWPTQLTSSWLGHLIQRGLVERRNKTPSVESERAVYLYGLTKNGEARLRRTVRVTKDSGVHALVDKMDAVVHALVEKAEKEEGR